MVIKVTNVITSQEPTSATSPIHLDVTFECYKPLEGNLDWSLVYVGNAANSNQDQVLDEIEVGPVIVGKNTFHLESSAPDFSKISEIGITALLLIGTYKNQEFVRIGYIIKHHYSSTEQEEKEEDISQEEIEGESTEDAMESDEDDTDNNTTIEEDNEDNDINQDNKEEQKESNEIVNSIPIKIVDLQRTIFSDKPRVTIHHVQWFENNINTINIDDSSSVSKTDINDISDINNEINNSNTSSSSTFTLNQNIPNDRIGGIHEFVYSSDDEIEDEDFSIANNNTDINNNNMKEENNSLDEELQTKEDNKIREDENEEEEEDEQDDEDEYESEYEFEDLKGIDSGLGSSASYPLCSSVY